MSEPRAHQIGAHAGDISDVVTDVVGDDGRVARVVLGQVALDLADKVGADIGSLTITSALERQQQGKRAARAHLGVDTAADAAEERDGRAAETVAGNRLVHDGGLCAGDSCFVSAQSSGRRWQRLTHVGGVAHDVGVVGLEEVDLRRTR